MSKQIRLEALKLAVAAGGGENAVALAGKFEKYIADDVPVASGPEIGEDAEETPTTERRRRRTKG